MSGHPRVAVRNVIGRLLFARGFTDMDLARMTGLPRARVNRLKNHRCEPTIREALLIAQALGRTVDEVFSLDAP